MRNRPVAAIVSGVRVRNSVARGIEEGRAWSVRRRKVVVVIGGGARSDAG